jgi:hypothetical protein
MPMIFMCFPLRGVGGRSSSLPGRSPHSVN